MRVKMLIFSLFFFHMGFVCYSKTDLEIAIQYYSDQSKSNNPFPTEYLKIDSIKTENIIHERLYNLYEFGYLAATYDVIFYPRHKVEVHFYTDNVFEMASLQQGNVGEEIMNKIGYDEHLFENKPFSHQRVVKLLNSILDYAENHGYPFAYIQLDSIKIENNDIAVSLNYQSGPMIVFDSLVIQGYDKVKSNFLMTHLGIYQGEPYEEQLIKEIPNKLKLLSFISLTDPPETIITDGKCNVYLTLNQKKVSKLDGILGILPNEKNGKSVLITGQLNLDLHNLFSSGKRLALEWQSYNANSQLLDALYWHPNLFRTPISIQGDFYLLKEDTTFINREFALELSLLSKKSSKLGFRSELISSRLISTYGYEDATEILDNTDYNLNYYGLNYSISRLNDLNLPSKGWMMHLNGSIGQKKIIKNPAFNDDVYNTIDNNSIQLKILGEVEKFWGIYKNILLRTHLKAGYLDGENLFQSDLFRIGGLRTLRGFVENQFFTSSFGVANLELRAMFSQETFFMVFYDQAVLTEDVEGSFQYPFGLGTGFSFTTNAGIFNLVFALGKSMSQPFGLEYSKIHFGYISRF